MCWSLQLDINASNAPQGIVHDVGAMNELSLPLVGSFGTIISGCPYSAPSLEERFTRTESVGDSVNFRLHIVSIFGRMLNWLMQFVGTLSFGQWQSLHDDEVSQQYVSASGWSVRKAQIMMHVLRNSPSAHWIILFFSVRAFHPSKSAPKHW